jgi:prophage antirepressor-like protein
MSNEEIVKAFAFEGRAVRVELIDGEPWWVAKDVAEALGYMWNGSARIEHVPKKWRGVTSVVTLRGDAQDMAVLSEQGLYWFLARSDKPAALPFQEWIAGEVLPSIRRTGQYSVVFSKALIPDFEDPLAAAEGWIEQYKGRKAAEHVAQLAQAAVQQLEVRAAEAAPKLAFIAEIEASPTTYLVGQAAKLIYQGTKFPIGQNRLFAWLRDHGFLHQIGSRRNTPTQHSLESGLMVQQVRTVLINDQLRVCPTPRLTGKGLVYLVEHFYQQVQAKGQGRQAPAMQALPLLQAPITRSIQQLALDLYMVDEDEDLAVDDPDRPTIEA